MKFPPGIRGECAMCRLAIPDREPMYACSEQSCAYFSLAVCRECTTRYRPRVRHSDRLAAWVSKAGRLLVAGIIALAFGWYLYGAIGPIGVEYWRDAPSWIRIAAAGGGGLACFFVLALIFLGEVGSAWDALGSLWSMPAEHHSEPISRHRRSCSECGSEAHAIAG